MERLQKLKQEKLNKIKELEDKRKFAEEMIKENQLIKEIRDLDKVYNDMKDAVENHYNEVKSQNMELKLQCPEEIFNAIEGRQQQETTSEKEDDSVTIAGSDLDEEIIDDMNIVSSKEKPSPIWVEPWDLNDRSTWPKQTAIRSTGGRRLPKSVTHKGKCHQNSKHPMVSSIIYFFLHIFFVKSTIIDRFFVNEIFMIFFNLLFFFDNWFFFNFFPIRSNFLTVNYQFY